MTLFVIEFATKRIKDIWDAFFVLVEELDIEIKVLSKEESEGLDFKNWGGDLKDAFLYMESG
jgi:hypothetical protein